MKLVNLPNCGTLPDFGNFGRRRQGVRPLQGRRRADAVRQGRQRQVARLRRRRATRSKPTIRKMMKIVLDAGYHGYVGIEYEGTKLSEPDGIARRRSCWRKCARSLVVHDTCSAQDTSFSTVLPNAATLTNPHLKKHKNMKNSPAFNLRIVGLAWCLLVAASPPTSAQNLSNGLVVYWPPRPGAGRQTRTWLTATTWS